MINWAKTVATMVLYSLLAALVFMLITWSVIWCQSTLVLQDRLSDLVTIVSEENCLSADGAGLSETGLGTYEKLLEQSQTSWLRFRTQTGKDPEDGQVKNYGDGLAYFVGQGDKTYYSYFDAPQRGSPIQVKVQGEMTLPVLIAPFGGDRMEIHVSLEKSYTTMGLKFYKDK